MPAYEAAIHTRWAADATLNGLLPAAKFVTGIYFPSDDDPNAPEPEYPYATMTFPGGQSRSYSNDDTIATPRVRIAVYHDRDGYDEAKTIMDAVMSAFDRKDFSAGGSDTILNMQAASEPTPVQDPDDGTWTFVVDFDVPILTGASQ